VSPYFYLVLFGKTNFFELITFHIFILLIQKN
jgi:hypothetical protein